MQLPCKVLARDRVRSCLAFQGWLCRHHHRLSQRSLSHPPCQVVNHVHRRAHPSSSSIAIASEPSAAPIDTRTRSARPRPPSHPRSLHQSQRQAQADFTANFPSSLSIQPQLECATTPNDVQRPQTKFSSPDTPSPHPCRSLATVVPGLRQANTPRPPRPPRHDVYR